MFPAGWCLPTRAAPGAKQVVFLHVVSSSIPAVLRERASLNPSDPAITYIDYEQEWDGVAETLTWAQLYRRVINAADQIRVSGSIGDRAVILAPQGLDYIVGFLAAMQAGLVAVPLSVPYGGAHDERTISVLADTSPTVLLTTSSVLDNVAPYAKPQSSGSSPAVLELDLLDLDSRQRPGPGARGPGKDAPEIQYLQYTSGSTRTPAGVGISNKNVFANFTQMIADFFYCEGGVVPSDLSIVSWLPLYHDMGLLLGAIMPILVGVPTVLTSPVGFLQRPARWMHLMASQNRVVSGGPNFAFELAVRKTSDEDMDGYDLGGVHSILDGSERVQPATLKRFADRFARFNFPAEALLPAYGMAEATVYIASRKVGEPPRIEHFDSEKLPAGQAIPSQNGGTPLVSYGRTESMLVRIVDPDTRIERPDGEVGEIWVQGDNIASGYWQKSEESENTFSAKIVNPSDGTPEGPWLRTGDSGFRSDGELYIIGRLKDLLIIYGRNHSPDDIEATIQEITAGRCVAIGVPDGGVEKLVAIVEVRKRPDSDDSLDRLRAIKQDVNAAIYKSHGLSVADLVLVSQGSIPITTSGKVRRAQCVELYRQREFTRLDV